MDKKVWFTEWEGFSEGNWNYTVDVRNFIQKNYTPYIGDESFLKDATENTKHLWQEVIRLSKLEKQTGGVLDMDPRVSFIDAYGPGYLNKNVEKIVGLQTEKPFVRAFMPIGGIRMAIDAASQYGFPVEQKYIDIYEKYRKTHNQGVFDAYTDEMKLCRKTHILTGLPDSYARGRIIGDYRRIALYGIDYLIEQRQLDRKKIDDVMFDENIKLREETTEQINALKAMKKMALSYGFDISKPAKTAKEAIQWTYFGYLAAIKDQNGAAMSAGRNSSFFDIYIERDIKNGLLTEQEAQELIDHYVMKLRMVKFMRIESYNDIFAGDPVWATEVIGGMGLDGRTLVTKSSYRMLYTLHNMGPAPEPNLTILWSKDLPITWKKFCARVSIKYSSIQYESDDLMKIHHGDDYAIACCVSAMAVGKEMQFFGARSNLAKALLLAINSGRDEIYSDIHLGPQFEPLNEFEPLKFDEIWTRCKQVLSWLAKTYVNTLNVIHYMHDKYYYEAAEMALYDMHVKRFFATGVAGLSVITDSLSAIKYAKVTPIWKNGIAVDFKIEGDYPKYGNDDNRVDLIAKDLVVYFMEEIRKQHTYRDSISTLSVLTITSNVMYGKNTGATPDGRKKGEAFAPGANPMHGRDDNGAIASLSSVSKIPYEYARDGISNTFTITPNALGSDKAIEFDLGCCINFDKE